MRRLKLWQPLDTLPERLALARSNRLPHHDFLEMLFAEEITRRDRESAQRRAETAHLDPQMQLQTWDDTTAVNFDRELWAELTSLRFLADGLEAIETNDFYELIVERHRKASTVITSNREPPEIP
ncbi:ATP-binding protein [Nocardia sp. SYP-A9097]|uniref:ATP-binding protein n=1 Tax=Nocardia sp. SYP-A9097 TaxID=2663237 RepID=UPI001E2931FF|nr:ATP-binding protein [Nocardia sp. SYP-A9097]